MTPLLSPQRFIAQLQAWFPEPPPLDLGDPFWTLVAISLSARTKDATVLQALPRLIAAFPTIEKMANASEEEIAHLLYGIGFYRTKAKHVKALAMIVLERHQGIVPSTFESLITLPGVGRKTARVFLAKKHRQPMIGVDIHVARISARLGWSPSMTPRVVEAHLTTLTNETDRASLNSLMVRFGRVICTPVAPRCWVCPFRDSCRFVNKRLEAPLDGEQTLKQAFAKEHALEAARQDVLALLDTNHL